MGEFAPALIIIGAILILIAVLSPNRDQFDVKYNDIKYKCIEQ